MLPIQWMRPEPCFANVYRADLLLGSPLPGHSFNHGVRSGDASPSFDMTATSSGAVFLNTTAIPSLATSNPSGGAGSEESASRGPRPMGRQWCLSPIRWGCVHPHDGTSLRRRSTAAAMEVMIDFT